MCEKGENLKDVLGERECIGHSIDPVEEWDHPESEPKTKSDKLHRRLLKATFKDNIVNAYMDNAITEKEAIVALSESRQFLRKQLCQTRRLSPPPNVIVMGPPNDKDDVCRWDSAPEANVVFETECGEESFEVSCDAPGLPNMEYCPFCGKRIKAVKGLEADNE